MQPSPAVLYASIEFDPYRHVNMDTLYPVPMSTIGNASPIVEPDCPLLALSPDEIIVRALQAFYIFVSLQLK